MHLRKPSDAPPGGFVFICEDGQRIDASNLRKLVAAVKDYLSGNSLPIPGDLMQIVEDQICDRVGPKFCWKGFGDKVATAIHVVAGAIDAVTGTQLQEAAKQCKTCGQRRRKLNRI
jgi:hypothetical protein